MDGDATRQQLAVATEEFSEHGYSGARVDEIERAAKGTGDDPAPRPQPASGRWTAGIATAVVAEGVQLEVELAGEPAPGGGGLRQVGGPSLVRHLRLGPGPGRVGGRGPATGQLTRRCRAPRGPRDA